jgi:PAS domain S-box-containing protein
MNEKNIAGTVLNVLSIEDSVRDFEIIREQLIDAGYHLNISRVETEKELESSIRGNQYDIILADFKLPGFDAFGALRLCNAICPEVPFICVSGTIGEETAVEVIKQGAVDYVLKDRMARLPSAVKRALDELKEKERGKWAESQREAALEALRSEQIMLARTEGIAHIGSWEWDIAMDTVIWSDELFRIFQRDPREGAPSFAEHPAFYHLDDMACLQQAVEAAVTDGTPYELELRAIRKDGETRICVARGVAEMDLGGRTVRLFGSLQDITERIRAREALRASEAFLKATGQMAKVGGWELDAANLCLNWTEETYHIHELHPGHKPTFEEAINYYHPDERQKLSDSIQRALKYGETYDMELRFISAKGKHLWTRSICFPQTVDGKIVKLIGTFQDITERKQAEEDLRKSEENFRSLYVDSADSIMVFSPDQGFIAANPATIKLFACRDEQDFTTHSPASLSPEYQPDGARSMDKSHEMIRLALEKGSHFFEWMHRRADGTDFPATVLLSRLESVSAPQLLQATVRDITELKRAGEALRQSNEQYRLLADNIHDVIFVLDMNLNYTYISPSVKNLRGYEPEELLNKSPTETLTPASMDLAMKTLSEIMELEKSEQRKDIPMSPALQLEMVRKDGTTVWTEVKFSLIRDENKRPLGIMGVTRDITEHRQAEKVLKQSEERYRSIFENAQEGIFRTTPKGKITISNQALANMLGYESSAELMTSITDLARQLYVNPEDRRKLQEMIEEHGFIKGYEIQYYKKDRSIIWGSMNMHAVRDENGQIIHWDGIAADITNRKQAEERLRKALGATVQAIAVTVEARDPYTAGHQHRVADLSRSIAKEMNLPDDQILGINMAATIHDLGKISVPAEILSKPTKLKKTEFDLIKEHSQSGYDILKDIDFPWPIARMVLEHHERMNGSGYPNGLTGENILVESKILAVADVVEAMASHRPYRPALGIDAALDEIEKNRGILYDDAVADSCLRLFREKGFQFEGNKY